MTRRVRKLVIAFALPGLIIALGVDRAGGETDQSVQQAAPPAVDIGAPGNTPFDQLPACNPGPFNPQASDVSRAPDPQSSRAKVCKAEPTDSVPAFAAGGDVPPPDVGHHFTGNETEFAAHWQGVRQTQRVEQANVCHGGDFAARTGCWATGQYNDFVAVWPMVASFHDLANQFDDVFTQSGWSENSENYLQGGGNVQRVFQFDTSDDTWHFYGQFPLSLNAEVSTLVKNTATGFGWEWTNYVWWNGVWNVLDSSWLDLDPNGNQNKELQLFTETFAGSGSHPTWDNTGGILMYKRQWFHPAFGWVNVQAGDFDGPGGNGIGSSGGPPYVLFGGPSPGLPVTAVACTNTGLKANC